MTETTQPRDVLCSTEIDAFLRRCGKGIVLASSDATRLLTVGLEEDGRLFTCEAIGANARAIAADGSALWVAGDRRITRWEYGAAPYFQSTSMPDGFYPRAITFTGALRADELVLDGERRPIAIDASGNAVRVDADGVGRPAERPPVLPTGLSRARSDGTRTFALRAETCELGRVDERGAFEPIATVPGIPTSLALHDHFAFVGLDAEPTAERRPALERLAAKDVDPRSGLVVVELATGRTVHWLRWMRVVRGVRSIALVDPLVRPMIASFEGL